ncbi:spore cortex-lytic enzyme-like [Coccinella septempunctata]|uniref:spore cortex-lytic enzyme-like n=1 Tax=Coccinella septempunctata TaxID=41139 RepID=UPI001D08BEDD|nr:spore cortex-lytic enzyme-like [Coccinella septempunctata]
MGDREILAKTVYAEARGEPEKGWESVAWVIKNRANANREYWGGSNIGNVCLKDRQFECWNGKKDIHIDDPATYARIKRMTDRIFDEPMRNDPTGGCDHYNNPKKEGYPAWTRNCDRVMKVGNHVFYKQK